jgi:hypothetical protein
MGTPTIDYRVNEAPPQRRDGAANAERPTGVPATLGAAPKFEAIAGIGHTTAIVVKSNGSVAWIVNPNEASGHYQVHAADTTGSRVVSVGPDIDPTSLALAESTLYWMQGGQAHAAPLN